MAQASAPTEPVELKRPAALIIAGQTLVLLLLFWRGSWYADDLQSMAQAKRASWRRSYLELPVFGHPMPGMRALDWVLVRIAPLNYHVVAVITATALGLSSWLLFCVLRRVFRPSPALLVLAALPAFSAIWLPPVLWWAAATEMIGAALSTTLCCYTLVRCQQGSGAITRFGWGLAAGLSLAFGLLFYERSLLGAVFAGLFVLAVSANRLADVGRVLLRAWAGYLSIALVALAYLRYYFTHGHVRQTPGYGAGRLLEYLWRSWADTLVPGLAGGPLRWQFVSNIYGIKPAPERFLNVYAKVAPPWWWVLLTELGALAIAYFGFRRNGWRSVRGWLIFVPVFLLAQYSIATARLTLYGVGIGDEPRYVSDLVPAAVLALGLVLLRPVDAAPPPPRRSAPSAWRGARMLWPARIWPALAVLAVCWLVFAISAVPVSSRWAGNRSKSYLANLRRSLDQADRSGPWSLYDTPVPNWLVPAAFVPYNRMSMIAPLVHPSGAPMDDATRPMLVVTEDGTAEPARFEADADLGRQCASSVAKGIVFGLAQPLPKDWWFLQLDYYAPETTRLAFVLDAGTGLISATGDVRTVHGHGRIVVALRQASITRIGIRTSRASMCVSNVAIGMPEPIQR